MRAGRIEVSVQLGCTKLQIGRDQKMVTKNVIAGLILLITSSASVAQDRNFRRYPCTVDCADESAGYAWARRRGITAPENCPPGNSEAFLQGCRAYTENPRGDAGRDESSYPSNAPRPRQR